MSIIINGMLMLGHQYCFLLLSSLDPYSFCIIVCNWFRNSFSLVFFFFLVGTSEGSFEASFNSFLQYNDSGSYRHKTDI